MKSTEVEDMNSNCLHESVGEKCIICDMNKMTGIHLYTSFICTDCEQEIIHTQTSDPKYQFYLNRLGRIKRTRLYS